jgi:prepilin-type N-terminal cleavage/methylation domain-containing protein
MIRMNRQRRHQYGFSLVELLVVMVIFGVFAGAVYSLYITHLKIASTRDEVLDVQQNVRIAMDRVTRDIRMAGMFVPLAIDKTMSTYSSVGIKTTPINLARVTISELLSAQSEKFVVTPRATLSDMPIGTNAVVMRPTTKNQIGATFTVMSSSATTGHLTLSPPPTYPNVPVLGDMILKVTTTTPYPETILYRINRTDTSHGCDNSPCLMRNTDIIAQGIDSIHFEYYLEGANTDPKTGATALSDDEVKKISALRVTVTGKTTKKTGLENTIKTRELKSLVKLRNYR